MKELLIVEPDHLLSRIYESAFTSIGYNVTLANAAQSGIMAADKLTPDLVILEIQLVEHSGIEFLYEFRSYSDWQHTPVIINTQVPPEEFNGSWQVLKNDLSVGCYLYKPKTNLKSLLRNAERFMAPVPSETINQ
jgi:DNA-binding response OmpR family regulator